MNKKRVEETDSYQHVGGVEQDSPEQETNTSLAGQLPHRTENPLVKANDSGLPEPGENEEHTGEPQDGGLTKDYRKTA